MIVNRSGEVMLIEQKNGPLAERDGEPTKVYADTEKNVVDIHAYIAKQDRTFIRRTGDLARSGTRSSGCS